jgi:stage II sporulation protein AA (anti-sigma F factor antagonist)
MELKKEVLNDGFLSISVTGRVDAVTAPQLEKEVASALASPNARCVLDLTHVDYMSSAGLRVLMMGAKAAAGVKGAFAVCSVQESVRSVLAMVGFLPLIEIHENHGAAVEAICKRLDGK